MKTLLFFTILLLASSCENNSGEYYIIAHRGASYLAPENTLASVNLAWELGTEYVEIDVYLSADKRIMVCHDDTVFKSAGLKPIISKTNSDELRKLDVGSWKSPEFSNEKLPFLEEVIATIPENAKLVVEIKCGPEIMPVLKEILINETKKDQLVFISFNWKSITAAKAAFPNNKCYWLSEDITEVNHKISACVEANLDGINLYHNIIDKTIVEKAKNHGLEVLCWTVDDPEIANQLIKLGVTGITTNRPAWMKSQLN